jgi:hypothetical protein
MDSFPLPAILDGFSEREWILAHEKSHWARAEQVIVCLYYKQERGRKTNGHTSVSP